MKNFQPVAIQVLFFPRSLFTELLHDVPAEAAVRGAAVPASYQTRNFFHIF